VGKHKNGVYVLSTWDIIKSWFSKKQKFKNKQNLVNNAVPPPPNGVKIVEIAIVLDNEVQEIIRAENALASLFLSQPKFYEIDPSADERPRVGWKFIDGKFVKPYGILKLSEQQLILANIDPLTTEETIDEK
jgi:hypothetical protein